eukprot:g31020.t1
MYRDKTNYSRIMLWREISLRVNLGGCPKKLTYFGMRTGRKKEYDIFKRKYKIPYDGDYEREISKAKDELEEIVKIIQRTNNREDKGGIKGEPQIVGGEGKLAIKSNGRNVRKMGEISALISTIEQKFGQTATDRIYELMEEWERFLKLDEYMEHERVIEQVAKAKAKAEEEKLKKQGAKTISDIIKKYFVEKNTSNAWRPDGIRTLK